MPALAADPDPAKWDAVLAEARGQTVYFNAWGGAENINAYVEWAGAEIERRYGVKLVHVKLDDTASAVAKVVAEKSVGKDERGSVDLIWINGENFAAMKERQLLMSPGWAQKLPNRRFVEDRPTIRSDFTIPVDGLESPWGMAKLVFFHDVARTAAASMPKSAAELLGWARKNPAASPIRSLRISSARPSSSRSRASSSSTAALLMKPVDEATFVTSTAPLFAYLDQLNPLLWRGGKAYPQNYPAMKQLLADDEVDIIFAFNPSEASARSQPGSCPIRCAPSPSRAARCRTRISWPSPTMPPQRPVRWWLADFLISPEAQARKQDPESVGRSDGARPRQARRPRTKRVSTHSTSAWRR